MAVDPVTGSNTGTSTQETASAAKKPASASAKASLDYDNFLKLLIAQMKNQDPTDPMKASEQIAQLATFSQVEQTIQTNANLETLITGNALTNASNYIGQTITSADETKTGVIASVRVYSDTMVAMTTEGVEIPIVVGVRVGAPAPASTDS